MLPFLSGRPFLLFSSHYACSDRRIVVTLYLYRQSDFEERGRGGRDVVCSSSYSFVSLPLSVVRSCLHVNMHVYVRACVPLSVVIDDRWLGGRWVHS